MAYRARIGAFHCIKKYYKKGEIQVNFRVSKWITFQIIRILLLIAGVESNPGPISQTNASIERAEEQLNHIRDLILRMQDKPQFNTDIPHHTQRTIIDRQHTPGKTHQTHQSQSRNKKKETTGRQQAVPNRPPLTTRNLTRPRRSFNATPTSDRERRKRNIIIFGLDYQPHESKWCTSERITNLISSKLQVNINTHHIDNIFWLGRHMQNKPILVKFTSLIIKSEIMAKKNKLKGTNIKFENDYHPNIRMTC